MSGVNRLDPSCARLPRELTGMNDERRAFSDCRI